MCVCIYVCDIQGKKRNYSLALNFALSASLLNLVFNNSGANAELQISSQKNQINWLSSQAPCQSLADVSTLPPELPNSTVQ